MTKIALITGITGQDGAYLAEFLLNKNYIVHGVKRRSSTINTERIDHLDFENNNKKNGLILHNGDLTDSSNIIRLVAETRPDEIYNLAAQSHVMVSFETPEYTANADSIGTLRILEAIRTLKLEKNKVLPSLHFRTLWKFRKKVKMNQRLLTQKVHMQQPSSTHIG